MGHPLELSSIETNYIEEWINQYYGQFSESIIYKGYILSQKSHNTASKWSSSILIVTNYHLLLFSEGKLLQKKAPKDYHLYDCKKLTSKIDYVLSVTFQKGKQKSKITLKTEQMNYIVSLIRRLRHLVDSEHCSSELVLNFKTPILKQPMERKDYTQYEEFLDLYRGWCSYYTTDPHQPMINYIHKCIVEGNNEIDLNEIQTSDSSDVSLDIAPLLYSLKHNNYFNSLIMKECRKESSVKALSDFILHNSQIKKLILKKCGNDSLQSIFLSLSVNKKNSIQILDISDQTLSNKSISSLINTLSTLHHSLVYFDISNCSIPAKMMTSLFEAFEKNYGMSLTMEYLNISFNKLDDQSNIALSNWIIKSRSHLKLKHLLLNSVGVTPYTLHALRYLTQIEHIDLSHNKIELGDIERFLYILGIPSLSRIDCNYCTMPKELFSLIFSKMSEKRLIDVHIELAGLNLGTNAEDNWDILFVNMALFKESIIPIRTLNLKNLKGSEKNILSILNVLGEMRVHELILEGVSLVYPQVPTGPNLFIQNNISPLNSPHFSFLTGGNSADSSSTSSLTGSRDSNTTSQNLNIKNLALDQLNNSSPGQLDGFGNKSFKSLFVKALQKIYNNPELKTLNIAQIGKIVTSFISTISKNSSVHTLDISNNSIGDQGALLLSSSLTTNRSLLALNIDANAISDVGWSDIARVIGEYRPINTRDSPSLPSTSSPSPVYSMFYPKVDFERLISITEDNQRRNSIYIAISKLQSVLINNGNTYYRDRKNSTRLPIGFAFRKPENLIPPTPIILYPVTPVPKDIIEQLNDKQSPNIEPSTQPSISSITSFLRSPTMRNNKLNKAYPSGYDSPPALSPPTLLQSTNFSSRNSPIPFILSFPEFEPSSSPPPSARHSGRIASLPVIDTNKLSGSNSKSPRAILHETRSSPCLTDQQVMDAIFNLESVTDYCVTFVISDTEGKNHPLPFKNNVFLQTKSNSLGSINPTTKKPICNDSSSSSSTSSSTSSSPPSPTIITSSPITMSNLNITTNNSRLRQPYINGSLNNSNNQLQPKSPPQISGSLSPIGGKSNHIKNPSQDDSSNDNKRRSRSYTGTEDPNSTDNHSPSRTRSLSVALSPPIV
eukprot:gene2586-3203_t